MANELEITGILKYKKDGVSAELSLSTRVDVSGSNITETIQNVTTASEPLNAGGIVGTKGYLLIENLDDTNTVNVRAIQTNALSALVKIPPNAFAGPFQLGVADAYVSTSANTAKIRTLIIEA